MPSPHSPYRILWPALQDPARLLVLRARFFRLVTFNLANGCWLWHGYVCKFGYGRWWRGKGVSALAHRGAFELFRHPILPDLQADHLCTTRHCVNPWHQEIVTQAEHLRRTAARRGPQRPARLRLRPVIR